METIQTIESQLNDIESQLNGIENQLNDIENQKKELLLKDLFLKSKLILDFLKIDEFVFANFPISSIIINHKEEYYCFNNTLEKLNLSIAGFGVRLKKNTKITTNMSFEQFKENIFSVNKNKNKIK